MIINSKDLPLLTDRSQWEHKIKHCEDAGKISFLMKITKELEQNYVNPDLKVKTIAKNIAVSERQIYRIFKEMFDMTPVIFLQQYRLEKAFIHIQRGEAFGNIAFDVGFSSHSYFSHCFKNKYGETPSGFMKKLNNEQLAEYSEEMAEK